MAEDDAQSESFWETYSLAGQAASDAGDHANAELYFSYAAKEAGGFGEEDPRLLAALRGLARSQARQGKHAAARDTLARAIALCDVADETPELMADLFCLLAESHEAEGDVKEARKQFLRAMASAEKAHGEDHLSLADSMRGLTRLLALEGKFDEAEPLLKRLVGIAERAGPDGRAEQVKTLAALAGLYDIRGKQAEAEALFARAIEIHDELYGADARSAVEPLASLIKCQLAQGSHREAEPHCLRLLRLCQKLFGPQDAQVANGLELLGEIKVAEGDLDDAQNLFERAMAIHEAAGSAAQAVKRSHIFARLASVRSQRNDLEGAEEHYRTAIEIMEGALGLDHPSLVPLLSELAVVYLEGGKPFHAEPLLRRAVDIEEERLGMEHADLEDNVFRLVTLYLGQSRWVEAEPLLLRLLAIRYKKLGPGHPQVARTLCRLAEAYRSQGKLNEAAPLYGKALAIMSDAYGETDAQTQSVRADQEELAREVADSKNKKQGLKRFLPW